ncbi:MAG: zf-HC2 domain-containing protein [Candidatus Omnitrophota bacterium]|nr:zf-HC2 domain-containing protein [Candidatus Omnitrophota bacterium]
MSCEEIKKLIPAYIKHLAPPEEIKKVEEHLCVCNGCRKYLSTFLDKEETFKENIEHPQTTTTQKNDQEIQIVSEQDIPQEDIPLELEEENKKEEIIEKNIEENQQEPNIEEKIAAVLQEEAKIPQKPAKPKDNKKIGIIEYLVMLIGSTILIFLVWLLMKG